MPSSTILSALGELGFSKKDAATYVALFELHIANANQIAKAAGVERTTVYDTLESLVQRGLAIKSVQGKRQTYIAEPPTRLNELVERQRLAVATIVPMLATLTGKGRRTPVIRFYDTIPGIQQAVMETVQGKEKLRRDFASVESIVDLLGQRFINRQIEDRVRRRVYVRSLRGPEGKGGVSRREWYLKPENKKLLREVRYLPQKFSFDSVVFLHDDTVTVVSSKKESFALVLQSEEISQALKVLFDIAWSLAN